MTSAINDSTKRLLFGQQGVVEVADGTVVVTGQGEVVGCTSGGLEIAVE